MFGVRSTLTSSEFDDHFAPDQLLPPAMSASTSSLGISAGTSAQSNRKRKRLVSPEDSNGAINASHIQDDRFDEFHLLLKDIAVILRK